MEDVAELPKHLDHDYRGLTGGDGFGYRFMALVFKIPIHVFCSVFGTTKQVKIVLHSDRPLKKAQPLTAHVFFKRRT